MVFTVAIGNTVSYPWRSSCTFRKYAELSGKIAVENLGLDKIIILSEEHLSQIDTSHIESFGEKAFYLKLFVFRLFPEIDRYLYFDVDWNCLNIPIERDKSDILDSEKLVVVRDRPTFDFVISASKKINIDNFRYFNAGFYVVNRKSHFLFFEKCIDFYKDVPKVYADQCMMNYVAFNYDYSVKYVNRMWNFMDRNGSFVKRLKCIGYHSPYNYDHHEGSIRLEKGDIEVDQQMMCRTSGWYLLESSGLYLLKSINKKILFLSDGFTDDENFDWVQDIFGNLYIIQSWSGELFDALTPIDGMFKSVDSRLVRIVN